MNLFFLDKMPEIAAQYNCDAHIRKIILESIEMMGCTYNKNEFIPWPWVSKSKFVNHPISKWVRNSRQNFDWTLQHSFALCYEFEYRFKKIHKCQEHVHWIANNIPIYNLSNNGLTEHPRCFGHYKDFMDITSDVVQDYRNYYCLAKRHLAKWSNRSIPYWYR